MPVGTSFENSTMKSSFSLSSLQQHKDMADSSTPEKDRGVTRRQCHSLTKQKKDTGDSSEASWRRSWCSTASDQSKEFWKAIEKNYNYIMDNELIENCQAATCEMSAIVNWTLIEFYSQFSDLYSWLNKVQDDIADYQARDKMEQLQEKYQANLVRNSCALKKFNQQAQLLSKTATAADLEEIDWRVAHLNSKWESIEAALKPSEDEKRELDTDIDNEIECLSKWLKTMEASIQEVDLWVKWTRAEIEAKRIEHKNLHQDIENHGRIVRSVVRRCEQQQQQQQQKQQEEATAGNLVSCGDGEKDHVDGTTDAQTDAIQRFNAVTDLEQRWYELCLRSHEWQYFIESLTEREPQLAIDCESKERMNPHQGESKSMSTNTEQEPTLSLFANENPKFNLSERKAQNLGTFYFKHTDTEDSDVEKNPAPNNDEPVEDMSSVSDNEWTYQAGEEVLPTTEEGVQVVLDDTATTTDDGESVQQLVSQAEELISGVSSSKLNRVKMWLERGAKNDTSCDASAEEDEDNDEKDLEASDDSSDELNESIATTCRQASQSIPATVGSQNISLDDLGLADQHAISASTPKVIMRSKVHGARARPLSDFCVSQLSERICDTTEGLSISESALNKLPLSIKKLNATSADADKTLNTNSTSSTVEDTTGALITEDRAGGSRKKRLKSKKKSMLRKSGESLTSSGTNQRPLIRKSGSFSGQGVSIIHGSPDSRTDRHAVSDPSALHRSYGRVAIAIDTTSTTSGVDSDEDKQTQRAPVFRLDLKTNYRQSMNSNTGLIHPPLCSQKSSLNNGEEQFSSMSEQAWDSFQEKYSSEAYSEAQDSDGARRLLEFGEDYRNYLDSQSDWSCQSAAAKYPFYPPQSKNKQSFSPQQVAAALSNNNTFTPLKLADRKSFDILANSQAELRLIETAVDRCITGGPAKLREVSSLVHSELITRCDSNISQLRRVRRNASRKSSDNSTTGSAKDIASEPGSPDVNTLDDTLVADTEAAAIDEPLSKAELMQLWVALRERLEGIREYRILEENILKLKSTYQHLKESSTHSELPASSTEDISMKIDIYKCELCHLDEKKKLLLELNVAVHRFFTEHQDFDTTIFPLKAEIAELYRISSELHTEKSVKLGKLSDLLELWRVLEMRLDQLCEDLRDDDHVLGLLDGAYDNGTFDQQMAVSARGVAKLLSETKLQNIPALFANTNLLQSSLSSMMLDGGASTCGGSFSDSGISDEGSEHEPGERERRLAAIRRLVRQLEHIISPNSIANIRMQERLQYADEELKSLRSRCRSFMTKSGADFDVPKSSKPACAAPVKKTVAPAGDPDDNPRRSYSWYRRIMRASIPFQLALVALVCLVFLLKPQCCDNMNTYTLSLQPQMHYTHGPPPT